jgi:hypothetical protein
VVVTLTKAMEDETTDETATKPTPERARARLNALLKTMRDWQGEDATAFEAFRADAIAEISAL